LEWTQCITRGVVPDGRTLHSAALINKNGKDRVYIFSGGASGELPIKDDQVYCLDIGKCFFFFKIFINISYEFG
jgi:hypothetical protein